MKRALVVGLVLLVVAGCAGRPSTAGAAAPSAQDAMTAAGPEGTQQCGALPGWAATWVDGTVAGEDAFAIIVADDGRLDVRGQSCGPDAVYKARRVCWSAAGKTLWVFWTSAPTAEMAWQLPYKPEQIGVAGECVRQVRTWFPMVVR